MRQRAVASEAARDFLRRTADEAAGQCRGEGVGHIVLAGQRQFVRGQQSVLAVLGSQGQPTPVQEGARCDLAAGREQLQPSTDGSPEAPALAIVRVEYGVAFRLLQLEQSRLGSGVLLEGRVTIEMVRTQIEQHRNVGPEGLNRLQLEGGELQCVPGLRTILVQEIGERPIQVAARTAGHTRSAQDAADHRRDGALAVGARDADDPAPAESCGQLDLAPDGKIQLARPAQQLDIRPHTGTDDQQIRLVGQLRRVATGPHIDAQAPGPFEVGRGDSRLGLSVN